VTETLYHYPLSVAIQMPISASNTTNRAAVPFAGVRDLYIKDFQLTFHIAGGGSALSASHKWVCTLVKFPANTVIATVNIDSGASSTYRTSGLVAIDALIGTTEFDLTVVATKTGTPGDLSLADPLIYYREVG
jgi:hypothetical protein